MGEARLRQYLNGVSVADINAASASWQRATTTLSTVAQALEKHAPNVKDQFADAETGNRATEAFQKAAKNLRDRISDLNKGSGALGDAATAITTAQSDLDGLPVAAPPGPKPEPPIHTNDWDPPMNMAMVKWQSRKAAYDHNPAVRDAQADAAADDLDRKLSDAADVMKGIHGDVATSQPTTSGSGGGGGTTTPAFNYTGTSSGTYTAPHQSTASSAHTQAPTYTTSDHTATHQTTTQHHSTSQPHDTTTSPDYTYDDGTLADSYTAPSSTATPATTTSATPAATPGTPTFGGFGGLGGAGGAAVAGGLGAAGLAAAAKAGMLGGAGSGAVTQPSMATAATTTSRAMATRPLGSTMRTGGQAVTGRSATSARTGTTAGRTGSTAGRTGSTTGRTGARSGGTHGSRGKDDKKRKREWGSYDDGSDWLDDEDAAPGVLS